MKDAQPHVGFQPGQPVLSIVAKALAGQLLERAVDASRFERFGLSEAELRTVILAVEHALNRIEPVLPLALSGRWVIRDYHIAARVLCSPVVLGGGLEEMLLSWPEPEKNLLGLLDQFADPSEAALAWIEDRQEDIYRLGPAIWRVMAGWHLGNRL